MPSLGQMIFWGGAAPPAGWLSCKGQLLPINENQELYSLLGTAFGGDGRIDFAIPDLGSRRVLGATLARPLGSPAIDTTRGEGTQGFLGLDLLIYTTAGGTMSGYPGQILPWASSVVPEGWAVCDGSELRIDQHPTLWSLLGTTFGGDGRTFFALPKLSGSSAVGTDETLPLGAHGSLPSEVRAGAQGSLALVYLIKVADGVPDSPLVSEIVIAAFDFAPPGWSTCQGQILPVAQYPALFSQIGLNFGGSGNTFALPDLGARNPVGPATDLPVGVAGTYVDQGSLHRDYLALNYLIALEGTVP